MSKHIEYINRRCDVCGETFKVYVCYDRPNNNTCPNCKRIIRTAKKMMEVRA